MSKWIKVVTCDVNGTPVSAGADVQYTDGATQATPTGTVALGKNASNVLHPVSLDASGNLNVNLAAGSISGGNAAASPTGSPVPASADYTGFNSGGNLVGVSSANPLPVNPGIVTVTATSTVSTINSTTTPLLANATFTGTAENIVNMAAIDTMVFSDQAGTVYVDFSTDGTNWDYTDNYTLIAGLAITVQNEPHGKFYRLRIVNGGVNQTVLRAQCVLQPFAPTQNKIQVGDSIATNDTAILTKGVITGKTTAGGSSYVDVKVNPSGALTAAVTAADGDVFVRSTTAANFNATVQQGGTWSTGRTWSLASGTDSIAVSGTVTSNQGGAPWTTKPDGTSWTMTGTSANVNITNGSIPVTGTFWQTTQPVMWTGQSVGLSQYNPYLDSELNSAVPIQSAQLAELVDQMKLLNATMRAINLCLNDIGNNNFTTNDFLE